MKTLAIISQKGGTGKSTVAVHLSVAASHAGHTTALIDLDPQANVAKWGDMRNNDTPIVISAQCLAPERNSTHRQRSECRPRYLGHTAENGVPLYWMQHESPISH